MDLCKDKIEVWCSWRKRGGEGREKEVGLRRGYQYRESNTEIGKLIEEASARTKKFKPGDRWLAWRKRSARKAKAEGKPVQDTLLGWMVDNGDEKETSISEMAARQCVLTLASIHTTSMSVSNMLFDLCAHPEWFSVLTGEIDEAVAKYGMLGSDAGMNPKQWLQTLEKMDSFFVESQRINPPILRTCQTPPLQKKKQDHTSHR